MAEEGTSTPARAFRAIKSSTSVVVPLSAIVTASFAIALYLRDSAIERLRHVEEHTEENAKLLQDHEGRIIRAETKAQTADESMRRVDSSLSELNAKIDRLVERSR